MSLFDDLVAGRQQLIYLRKEIEDYRKETNLPLDVIPHIERYFDFIQTHLNKNRYPNDLNTWYPYAARGPSYIKGKRGELCYVVIANQHSRDGTTYHFHPESNNQIAENRGEDCIIKNIKWKRIDDYTAQVKCTEITDDSVVFRLRFLESSSNYVHRLALVDPDQRVVLEMNYYMVARVLGLDTGIKRDKEDGERKIIVPFRDLERVKSVKFRKLSYKKST